MHTHSSEGRAGAVTEVAGGAPQLAWVWAFGSTIVTLVLVVSYFLGAQIGLLGGPSSRPAERPVASAPAASKDDDPADGSVAPQAFAPMTPGQAEAVNAGIPFSVAPNPAAQPFTLPETNPDDVDRARACLTMAVYYEAASQGDLGEAAVAQVVLNRLRNPRFPKTVCGVVFQGSTLPTGCQFTFTCDGSLARPPDPRGWKKASEVAVRALNGYVVASIGEATHYHTVWVVPYWRSTVEKITQIGAHIFYRWPGALGRPAAFARVYAGAEPLPPFKGLDLDAPNPQDAAEIIPTPVKQDLPTPGSIEATPAIRTLGRAGAPALLPPASPPKYGLAPATVKIENAGINPKSNGHLAIPASW